MVHTYAILQNIKELDAVKDKGLSISQNLVGLAERVFFMISLMQGKG
jgi:hypothetical protein